MLLPALAKAKQKALQANCVSNLKQIGSACAMYTHDFNDYLPGPCWSGMFCIYQDTSPLETITANPNKYFGALAAYIATYLASPAPSTFARTSQVMICPAGFRKIPPGRLSRPGNVPVLYFSPEKYFTQIRRDERNAFKFPFGRPNGPFAQNAKLTSIPRPTDQWPLPMRISITSQPVRATLDGCRISQFMARSNLPSAIPLLRLARQFAENYSVKCSNLIAHLIGHLIECAGLGATPKLTIKCAS